MEGIFRSLGGHDISNRDYPPGLRFLIIVTAGVTVLLTGVLLGIPGLNGIWGWHWHYRSWASLKADGTLLRGSVAIPLGIGLLILVYRLLRQIESGSSERIALRGLLVLFAASLILQGGFALLNPWGLIQVPITIFDRWATSYYTEAVKIIDLRVFLKHYTEMMPTLTLHAKVHPPGPILFFWGFNQLFEHAPWATAFLDSVLRPTLLSLESIARLTGLSASQATGLIVSSFLVPTLGSATLVPLYFLARDLWDHRVGFLAAALWVIVPSLILFTPEMDQLYALISTTSVLCAYRSVRKLQTRLVFLSSAICGVGLFFSFAFLAIMFLNLLVFTICAIRKAGSEASFCVKAINISLLTVIGMFVCLYLLSGFDILEASTRVLIPRTAQTAGLGTSATYCSWVVYNLYDFFVIGLGLPLLCVFGYYLLQNRDSLIRQDVNTLLVAFLITLLCLNFSGVTLGEVARIWLFMLPFPVLYAARRLHDFLDRYGPDKLIYLLALQYILLLVYKVRLEMIGVPQVLKGLPLLSP